MKPRAVLDVELYVNYLLIKFRRVDNGVVRKFEKFDGQALDIEGLRATLRGVTSVTFNGRNYDMVIIGYAMCGASCAALKRLSDFIINGNMRPWDCEKQFGFRLEPYDHIDLIEVKPTISSLKIVMGKMHCAKMQELPIEHTAEIWQYQREQLSLYNDNDLEGTAALLKKFAKQIALREKMSAEYGIDMRSKSDAQIAEAVIKSRLTALGVNVTRPEISQRPFKFKIPEFMSGAGPIVQALLRVIAGIDFCLLHTGYIDKPDALKSKVKIGQGVYSVGIGGLHSTESAQTVYAGDDYILADVDVASNYPKLIDNLSLYPPHLTERYLEVYRGIIKQRMAAKRSGDKSTADSLKIVLNGLFGKYGNPYSIVYAPSLMLQVTLSGQLALLMLIEWIESSGVAIVVSANTDGIVIRCPRSRYGDLRAIIKRWEDACSFETEETRYSAIFSRDVNNYIAIHEDQGLKKKGAYADPEPVASSWPSPQFQITVDAVIAFLQWGTPIKDTILKCKDIRQFVCIRKVVGGAKWREQPLGKAVRWYISSAPDAAPILSMKKGDQVARTWSARPCMDLPASLPGDINFDWYIKDAMRILADVGYFPMARKDSKPMIQTSFFD